MDGKAETARFLPLVEMTKRGSKYKEKVKMAKHSGRHFEGMCGIVVFFVIPSETRNL